MVFIVKRTYHHHDFDFAETDVVGKFQDLADAEAFVKSHFEQEYGADDENWEEIVRSPSRIAAVDMEGGTATVWIMGTRAKPNINPLTRGMWVKSDEPLKVYGHSGFQSKSPQNPSEYSSTI